MPGGSAASHGKATAITPSTILRVRKRQMAELLHKQSTMSDRFIRHMLTRNIRIEEDLIDQLFNSSEKRLARTLLSLALWDAGRTGPHGAEDLTRYARRDGRHHALASNLPEQVQEAGLHRARGALPIKINNSLLSVVLHD